jgi:hypothetical protein
MKQRPVQAYFKENSKTVLQGQNIVFRHKGTSFTIQAVYIFPLLYGILFFIDVFNKTAFGTYSEPTQSVLQ